MPVSNEFRQEVIHVYGIDSILRAIAGLKLLRDSGPFNRDFGVCANVSKATARFPLCHRLLVENWEHYSGDPVFPVPHPTKTPAQAFQDACINKWSRNTDYSKKRWEFLDYLIASLEECIK